MSLRTSIGLFVLAAFLEIGGGWLIWKWWRDGAPLWTGLVGAILLAGYGFAATYQPADFGRVYAAYGGVFIVGSLAWAAVAEKSKPDLPTMIGAAVAIAGAAIIMYWPRTS